MNSLSGTLALCLIFSCYCSYAKHGSTVVSDFHTDLPVVGKNGKITWDYFYLADTTQNGLLDITFVKYGSKSDSIIALHKSEKVRFISSGVRKRTLKLSSSDTGTYVNTLFGETMKRTHSVPPGEYKVFVSVKFPAKIYQTQFIHTVDSELAPNSRVRHSISEQFVDSKKAHSFVSPNPLTKIKAPTGNTVLTHKKKKIERAARKHGLTLVEHSANGLTYIDLYYQSWFAGRYTVAQAKPITDPLAQEQRAVNPDNFKQLAGNNLDHPSLFSQYKQLNTAKKDGQEIKGEVAVQTNLSTAQPEYSGIDNNYYELRGRVELPVMGLPVEVEGLYTSQDAHRQVKSSYFRVHYDVDQMKDGLAKSMRSYNGKVADTKAKAMGLEQVYNAGIANLESQRSRLLQEIEASKPAVNTNTNTEVDTSAARQQLNGVIPVNDATSDVSEKKAQLEKLDAKIDRYKRLLEQNRNTMFFDSAVAFRRTKELDKAGNISYKQMAKMGADLLPDGKAKSFISGITTMDVGMFPKNSSKYTMDGQMMKGADFGYDLNVCEVNGTVGKTQYVGRDGSMDQYTCYSAKSQFKLADNQKMALIYYGYAPDQKVLSGDAFFAKQSMALPSFFNPVHIFSGNYSGQVSQYVTVNGEAATSLKPGQGGDQTQSSISKENAAYSFSADGIIPISSPISLSCSYDEVGKKFENNTLPFARQGTEQYKIAGKADLFKAFINLGIDFNKLTQQNTFSSSSAIKWGFDFKTNSKRYPSLAVSYKPFTTIRSVSDTLSIPQRPMFGSTTTGRLSYQIKHQKQSIRFSLLYSKAATSSDTMKYANSTMQLLTVYSDKRITGTASVGSTVSSGSGVVETVPAKTKFFSGTGGYNVSSTFNARLSQDVAWADFGLCKYGAGIGATFLKKRLPFSVRFDLRYNRYKLTDTTAWKTMFSGNMEIVYQFKTRRIK